MRTSERETVCVSVLIESERMHIQVRESVCVYSMD